MRGAQDTQWEWHGDECHPNEGGRIRSGSSTETRATHARGEGYAVGVSRWRVPRMRGAQDKQWEWHGDECHAWQGRRIRSRSGTVKSETHAKGAGCAVGVALYHKVGCTQLCITKYSVYIVHLDRMLSYELRDERENISDWYNKIKNIFTFLHELILSIHINKDREF